MPDQLFVEPAQLELASRQVTEADAALRRAAGSLAGAASLADHGLDHDGRADDKVSTFVRQWRSEFDLIARMLIAYRSVLDEVAAAYRELDRSIVDACAGG